MINNKKIVDTLFWDDRAQDWLDTWNITQDEAESIVLYDTRPTLDPSSTAAGHPILRFRKGDVIVVVGLREQHRPKVLSVFMHIPGMKEWVERTTSSNSGSSLPTTNRQLRSWIIDFGYRIIPGGGKHDKVADREDGTVIYSLPNTPSDHRSLANAWKAFLKEHAKYQARKTLRVSH